MTRTSDSVGLSDIDDDLEPPFKRPHTVKKRAKLDTKHVRTGTTATSQASSPPRPQMTTGSRTMKPTTVSNDSMASTSQTHKFPVRWPGRLRQYLHSLLIPGMVFNSVHLTKHSTHTVSTRECYPNPRLLQHRLPNKYLCLWTRRMTAFVKTWTVKTNQRINDATPWKVNLPRYALTSIQQLLP